MKFKKGDIIISTHFGYKYTIIDVIGEYDYRLKYKNTEFMMINKSYIDSNFILFSKNRKEKLERILR